jgi:DNA-binding response OmpR family regulator
MNSRILIVEDELLVALDLEDIVTRAGHEVIGCATDRAAALALAKAPQIALIDLNLRDGPTGTTIARELAHRHDARIIFVTANPAQIGDPPAAALGYVVKPYSEEAILAAIRLACAQEVERLPQGLHLFAGMSCAARATAASR